MQETLSREVLQENDHKGNWKSVVEVLTHNVHCPWCGPHASYADDSPTLERKHLETRHRHDNMTLKTLSHTNGKLPYKYRNISPPNTAITSHQSLMQVVSLLHHLQHCHSQFSYECVKDFLAKRNFFHIVVRPLPTSIKFDTSHANLLANTTRIEHIGGNYRNWFVETAMSLRQVDLSKQVRDACKDFLQYEVADMVLSSSEGSTVTGSEEEEEEDDICDGSSDANCSVVSVDAMTGSGRQYYHKTGLPVLGHESSGYKSDDDTNMSWRTELANRLVDELSDLCMKEKRFMKLWNVHVSSFPIYGDLFIVESLKLFAKRYAPYLLFHQLRHCFLMHLLTMWDFCLITSDDICTVLNIIDQVESRKRRLQTYVE